MLSDRKLKQVAEQLGPAGYLRLQARLLGLNEDGTAPTDADGNVQLNESVEFDNKKMRRMRPREFSLRGLWEGLVGPVEETLEGARDAVGFVSHDSRVQEAVSSGAFPSAAGMLIASAVIEGYETGNYIGDELVTVMPSRVKNERIVGFSSLQGPREVAEGEEYAGSTFNEKYVGTRETKRGRLLELTEEAIIFDQTNQVMRRASMLGETARQERERRIVRAVIDASSTEAVYQPSGTPTQLYSSGNNNKFTSNKPLVDWTDIDEILTWHAQNVSDDREADDELSGQPILWNPPILLTARELAGVAARIVGATQYGGASDDMITANPLNMNGGILPGLRALSSPFIDRATDGDQWDDASDWLLGDFKKQFMYKQIWALRTTRARLDDGFRRDVVACYKISEYGDVVCTDTRHVVLVNAA